MNAAERAAAVLAEMESLNAVVRNELDEMTLADARRVARLAREIKGWALGIEDLVTSD